MRKGILWFGLLLVLMMGMTMVSADDSTPKPGTPADNECYPGGVLYREENQDGCPTLWYWKAGWFLARYNRGSISRADFPKEFVSVLPPEEKPQYPCWNDGDESLAYIGPANQKGNALFYIFTANCTGESVMPPGGKTFIVFANNQPDASAICATQGTISVAIRLNSVGWNAPADAYVCVTA
ncbi:MAG: hypothetical protein H0X30_11890 [Anaerolineae bacterium]|nr:hypothetical protein [Anaerolineae bacterium]